VYVCVYECVLVCVCVSTMLANTKDKPRNMNKDGRVIVGQDVYRSKDWPDQLYPRVQIYRPTLHKWANTLQNHVLHMKTGVYNMAMLRHEERSRDRERNRDHQKRLDTSRFELTTFCSPLCASIN